ncbi:MAG: AAA family ATPase, partial [Dehalococcoidia bacterium]|nr:AAA family ATPase [Dehalococcoidia bacterium]
MLAELKIKSFGIIDELIWEPSKSFNVITGETGAGKSLVIDAIEALLAGKLDEESIRFGDASARIEAVFSLPNNSLLSRLHALLEYNGVVAEDGVLLISCDFRRQGRAVLRINGSAVTRALLREIGTLLVDVHAQSQHLSLFDRRQHLNYLDAYADTMAQRAAFAERAACLYVLQDELAKLRQAETERVRRQEILHYQHDEISRAKLKDGEEESLEQQRRVMASCEKLKALAYEVYQSLNGDDESVALSRINGAMRAMNGLVSLDPSLKAQSDTLKIAAVSLGEVARDIHSYEEGLEYDPHQLEEIELRLELIHTMKKRYGASVAQVLEKQQEIEAELTKLDFASEETARLEDDIMKLKNDMEQQSLVLSQKRQQAITYLEEAVEKELIDLGMAHVRFSVHMIQKDASDGLHYNDKTVAFTKDGVDEVEFMVSTNTGEPLKSLTDIASTGEVSRFT